MKSVTKMSVGFLAVVLLLGMLYFWLSDPGQENPANSEGQASRIQSTDVPSAYFERPSETGRVVEVQYASLDYTQDNPPEITKTAYVYLPAGYDEADTEKRYNILYLMHGWRMTAGDFFNYSDLVTILNNMHANGDIEPTIVVTPTFDAENRSQDFSRSEDEIRHFHQDFRNNLVPYIESNYPTYAEGISEEAFRDSRAHRAFAGFSGGSVTTWSQFIHNLDYIRYFGPMSGDSWEVEVYGGRDNSVRTVDVLENAVRESNLESDDYYIYAATGTEDFANDLITTQVEEMRTRPSFTPDNLTMAINDGGVHDLVSVQEYLYNMLPLFFGK